MSILLNASPRRFPSTVLWLRVAFAAVGAMVRTVARRRAARRVADLPDFILTDIGLKRDDVHQAALIDWRSDPTYRCAITAAGRRRA